MKGQAELGTLFGRQRLTKALSALGVGVAIFAGLTTFARPDLNLVILTLSLGVALATIGSL